MTARRQSRTTPPVFWMMTRRHASTRLSRHFPNAWSPEALSGFLKGWLSDNGLKMKDIGLPLRAALTGTKQSPSITDVMVALGPEEVAERIRKLAKFSGSG